MRRVRTSREALDEQVMMLTRVRIKTAACDLGRRWRNELSNVGKETVCSVSGARTMVISVSVLFIFPA